MQREHPELVPLDGGQPIPLTKAVTVVGRNRNLCDICLDAQGVSKTHAVIEKSDNELVVRDLDSTNGIRINGNRVMQGRLAAGDTVAFAKMEFHVSFPDVHPSVGRVDNEVFCNATSLDQNRLAAAKGSLDNVEARHSQEDGFQSILDRAPAASEIADQSDCTAESGSVEKSVWTPENGQITDGEALDMLNGSDQAQSGVKPMPSRFVCAGTPGHTENRAAVRPPVAISTGARYRITRPRPGTGFGITSRLTEQLEANSKWLLLLLAGFIAMLVVYWPSRSNGLPRYEVLGKVVFKDGSDGSQLVGYIVSFESVDTVAWKSKQRKVSASGVIHEDGTFVMSTLGNEDGVVLGRQRVAVSPPPPHGDGVPPKRLIPAKYSSFETSELQVLVEPRKNDVILELERSHP